MDRIVIVSGFRQTFQELCLCKRLWLKVEGSEGLELNQLNLAPDLFPRGIGPSLLYAPSSHMSIHRAVGPRPG